MTTSKESLNLSNTFSYHSESKHRLDKAARAPEAIDWTNEPSSIRFFSGTKLLYLPFMLEDDTPSFYQICKKNETTPRPVSVNTIGQLFELSLAVSAWKESRGSYRSLRITPSSGNLHPTEAYLIAGSLETGVISSVNECTGPTVSHYSPLEHALEIRSHFSMDVWTSLMLDLPTNSFLIGLSSIYWREAWKYGERAFRYCQLDIGHALAALRLSAAVLGWQLKVLTDLSEIEVGKLLGLDRSNDFVAAELEEPELIAVIVPQDCELDMAPGLPADLIDVIAEGNWFGKANQLSDYNTHWNGLDLVSEASSKPSTQSLAMTAGSYFVSDQCNDSLSEVLMVDRKNVSARLVISRRRSAVHLDGQTELPSPVFYNLLASTIPRSRDNAIPWDTVGGPTLINLCIFVHRVTDLKSGLYILVRDPSHFKKLRSATLATFLWERPVSCPASLPFYLLKLGDYKEQSRCLACYQQIAADGAFCLAMIAEFEVPLRRFGAWYYKNLFWEAGTVGHMLYLKGGILGLSGTGIGCFLDDPLHEILGLQGLAYQSLYHFTLGGAVEDQRLTELPPYSIEQRKGRPSWSVTL